MKRFLVNVSCWQCLFSHIFTEQYRIYAIIHKVKNQHVSAFIFFLKKATIALVLKQEQKREPVWICLCGQWLRSDRMSCNHKINIGVQVLKDCYMHVCILCLHSQTIRIGQAWPSLIHFPLWNYFLTYKWVQLISCQSIIDEAFVLSTNLLDVNTFHLVTKLFSPAYDRFWE